MQGQLRSGVNVTRSGDMVRIAYALWEIGLPTSWVDSKPPVRELLERKRTKAEAMSDPEVSPLLQLLEAQGCFVPEAKASYTLREVRALFDPLRSEWYSAYYAHPIWERIRSGGASRNELIAWVLHNYHVSRAAGIVGARMAAMGKNAEWKKFFEHDALDEYWHCDAYYFIDAPDLRVSADDAKAYVQLPSSLAFEQHTLQVAETDPLGHVLIAYFQESSIVFEEDSDDFYRRVEDAYKIPDFFRAWKQHIRIDVEHRHAEGLGGLLDSDVEIGSTTLAGALRNAWLAFAFLKSSLDEIRDEEREGREVRLRLPVRGGRLDRRATALLADAPVAFKDGEQPFSDLQSLYDWYTNATGGPAARVERTTIETSMAYLRLGLVNGAFRALGFSRDHDEIMVCGRLANVLSATGADESLPRPTSPWDVAIVNHLCEAAISPVGWTMLLDLLIRRVESLGTAASGLGIRRDRLASANRLRSVTALTPADANRWLTALLSFDELLDHWVSSKTVVPADLMNE